MRKFLNFCLKLALTVALGASAVASTTVNATLRDPSGNPVKFAYLQFDLKYCGYNVPAVPSSPFSMVSKSVKFTQAQLPGTIYGNDEITCGNSYSTVWHVTAFTDASTPIAGDADFVICSSLSSLSYCPSPSGPGTWNLAQAQPFSGTPPPPGFQSIFGNPKGSQKITQPTGSTFTWVGGTVDFTNTTVIGISGGGGGTVNLSSPPPVGNVVPNTGAFTNLGDTNLVSTNNTFATQTTSGDATFTGPNPFIELSEDSFCAFQGQGGQDQICDYGNGSAGIPMWNSGEGQPNLAFMLTQLTQSPQNGQFFAWNSNDSQYEVNQNSTITTANGCDSAFVLGSNPAFGGIIPGPFKGQPWSIDSRCDFNLHIFPDAPAQNGSVVIAAPLTVNSCNGCVYLDVAVYQALNPSGTEDQWIAAAIATLGSNSSAIVDATKITGAQVWAQDPFAAAGLLGHGYLPSKTGILNLGCNTSITVRQSNPIPTGWTVGGCGNNFVSIQATALHADSTLFPKAYNTGTVSCTGATGTPLTFTCTGVGTTFVAAQVNSLFISCINAADGSCGGAGATAASPSFGTIKSVNSATSITVYAPSIGSGVSNSGVNYVIFGCIICMGDNTTQGAGNQNFGVQIHGFTMDANDVDGAVPLWNSNGANLARAYDFLLAPSNNIGLAIMGSQAQNSDIDHFWITANSCQAFANENPIGIVYRIAGASALVSFGDGSLAMGSCNGPGGGVNGTGSTITMAVGAMARIQGIHLVSGSSNSNTPILLNMAPPCPKSCPVSEGPITGGQFVDFNATGNGAQLIEIGTANSPNSYTLEGIKTIGSSTNFTNLLLDNVTGCGLTWATEKTLGVYSVTSAGNIGYSTSGVPTCSGISTAGPISAGTTITATGAISSGATVSATGGFIDKSIGFLTNTMSTQSIVTPTPITTMSWTLVASKSYRLSCYIPVTFAPSATIAFELVGPGSPTHYTMTAQGPIGAAAVYAALHGVSASTWVAGVTNASGAPGSGVTEDILIEAGIQNGTTPGTMTLDSIANGTNTIQILKDASCVLTQTN